MKTTCGVNVALKCVRHCAEINFDRKELPTKIIPFFECSMSTNTFEEGIHKFKGMLIVRPHIKHRSSYVYKRTGSSSFYLYLSICDMCPNQHSACTNIQSIAECTQIFPQKNSFANAPHNKRVICRLYRLGNMVIFTSTYSYIV